ncbi:MAG: hypothetical protein U0163_14540 [Gemmatimonadaceae bacterium]
MLATINGPGEVAAWLFPFVTALRERCPSARVSVALLPCVFASGRERRVVENMAGIHRVLSPQESVRWILSGRTPPGLQSPHVLLHLGGEFLLSARLARRLGVPLVVYEEGRPRWPSLASRVCVRDVPWARGSADRVHAVGNLMVDAARLRVPVRPDRFSGPQTVALFPGSRPYFVRQLLPMFLRAAALTREAMPDVDFVLAKSDFISLDELRTSVQHHDSIIPGDRGTIIVRGRRLTIESATGVRVDVLAPSAALHRATTAVTIPGTNTAELGALGIPFLTVLPAYRLRALPLPGLAGHLGRLPLAGPLIKEASRDCTCACADTGHIRIDWRGGVSCPNS